MPENRHCPRCGQPLNPDDKFCHNCGEPVGLAPCPNCGRQVGTDARYCPYCSHPMKTSPTDIGHNVWRTGPDDFAVRIEAGDLPGALHKAIEVQPGQRVVLLVDGRAAGEPMGPGSYTVKSLFDPILGQGRHVTALLVQGGPVTVAFEPQRLFTADDFEVRGRCEAGVEVGNPAAFFAHVMRGRQTFSRSDVRDLLAAQVRDAVQDVVRRHKLAELPTGLAVKGQLTTAILMHLDRTLEESGLKVGEVRTYEFIHPRYDALRRKWEETRLFAWEIEADTALTVAQKQAELDRRRKLIEIDSAADDVETQEQRRQARVYSERAAVRQQMREAVLSDRMAEVRNEEQLAVFLRQIDKDRLIREEEWDRLQREYAGRWEDQDRARMHLAAMLALEQEYEEKTARSLSEHRLTMAQFEHEREAETYRQRTLMAIEEERALWEIRLAAQRNQARRAEEAAESAAKRERDLVEHEQRLKMRLQEARTEYEIRMLENELDRLDLELGLAALEKLKAIRRRDYEERLLIDLRAEWERQKMRLELERSQREDQILLERSRHEMATSTSETAAETKNCPSCHVELPASARFCSACGHQFH